MFESPHRLAATLADLLEVCGPARKLTVARELTKRFEEIATFALGEGAAWLAADPHREQGEFVLIVHADEAAEDEGEVDARARRVARRLAGNPVRARRGQGGGQGHGPAKDALYSRARCKRPPATGSRRDRESLAWSMQRSRPASTPTPETGLPGHAHAAGRDAPGRQRQGLRGAWFTDQALLPSSEGWLRDESNPILEQGRRELEEWFARTGAPSRWRWIRSARRSSMKSGARCARWISAC